MPDPTNDIDNLLHDLAKRRLLVWHSVVTALVAERNGLLKSLERMQSRAESCEARFESLHLDELDWKKERKELRKEIAALAQENAQLKQRVEAMRKGERDA